MESQQPDFRILRAVLVACCELSSVATGTVVKNEKSVVIGSCLRSDDARWRGGRWASVARRKAREMMHRGGGWPPIHRISLPPARGCFTLTGNRATPALLTSRAVFWFASVQF